MKIIALFIVLSFVCCDKKEYSKRAMVTPASLLITDTVITSGVNLDLSAISFDFIRKDTMFHVVYKDSTINIQYGDSIQFLIIKNSDTFFSNLANKDPEVKELIKLNKIESDFDFLKLVYYTTPEEDKSNDAILTKLKETISPAGIENRLWELKGSRIKGFKFCQNEKCTNVLVELYIGNMYYTIVSRGISSSDIDAILGSIKLRK